MKRTFFILLATSILLITVIGYISNVYCERFIYFPKCEYHLKNDKSCKFDDRGQNASGQWEQDQRTWREDTYAQQAKSEEQNADRDKGERQRK